MSTSQDKEVLGRTLVNFSRDNVFPEEDEVSAMQVEGTALSAAMDVLAAARSDLEKEIRSISRETAPGVDSWINHAKAVQEDIDKSRSLANDIVREAEAGESNDNALKTAEQKVEWLAKEVSYNAQVSKALEGIKLIKGTLDEVEQVASERKILKAIYLLENAWEVLGKTPGHTSTRAMRLLSDRALELRQSIHEEFDIVWNALVNIDIADRTITIQDNQKVDELNLESSMTVIQAYKEWDNRVNQFRTEFNAAIIEPRIDLANTVCSIVVEGNELRTTSVQSDRTIKSLFIDLEQIVLYLNNHLPPDFSQAVSKTLMPGLCTKITETWLDSAIPSSISDMTAFRQVIALVQIFAEKLDVMDWTGAADMHHWVANAPRLWLSKRRESSLDWTRNQLSLGIGNTRSVDRKETQTISRSEGEKISSASNGAEADWDTAWSDEEPDTDKDNVPNDNAEDEAVDAWGWNDDESTDADKAASPVEVAKQLPVQAKVPQEKTITLTEKYTISSMPDPILKTIKTIIEDGVTLTQESNEQNPVTSAAVGLFGLPTLVLAMYRAVSPYYYTLNVGGNMYLYNDAMWLAEQLRDIGTNWAERDDLNPRMFGKVKLDTDISALELFGKRAYGNEMSTQRTVLNDLLGGAQNFLQQDQGAHEDEAAVDSVVSIILKLASDWGKILSKSAWSQAIGSLIATVAKKIIFDVEDLTALGADEAYRVAKLIAKILQLDSLFTPETANQNGGSLTPVTAQYVPNWLKLNYLSEVLQSDLNDIKFLWFESELSFYFTAQEVVDLIELSFESSHRTRDAIASIRAKPFPKEAELDGL